MNNSEREAQRTKSKGARKGEIQHEKEENFSLNREVVSLHQIPLEKEQEKETQTYGEAFLARLARAAVLGAEPKVLSALGADESGNAAKQPERSSVDTLGAQFAPPPPQPQWAARLPPLPLLSGPGVLPGLTAERGFSWVRLLPLQSAIRCGVAPAAFAFGGQEPRRRAQAGVCSRAGSLESEAERAGG